MNTPLVGDWMAGLAALRNSYNKIAYGSKYIGNSSGYV